MGVYQIIVIAFLFAALYFYILFGGADFGAGILELFSSKKNKLLTQRVTYRVIGPVWEANHVWLIVVMVILWVGFPNYFNVLVVQLHIPLTLVLVGIIARGTAFIFRHYDAIKEPKSQKVYNAVFRVSSLLTPFMIGMTAGSLISGNIHEPNQVVSLSFSEAFILPWWNLSSISIGVFTSAVCGFIASAFLVGETEKDERKVFIKRALTALIVMVSAGTVVFASDVLREADFVMGYFTDWKVISMLVVSAVLLFPLWKSLKSGHSIWIRLFTGAQMLLVLGAWVLHSFPNLILTRSGSIHMVNRWVGEEVYKWLAIALLVGSVFILPGLFHLYKMFTGQSQLKTETDH